MLGGLSIWTSSFSKRKMNYSWTATLFFLSGIENGEGQWNINILIINNIFELMIHFVSYLDMPRIKDQFHFFISRQHKITFTFYYLKNRKKSHFEYITLWPLSINLAQLAYSLSHVFLFWLRSIASLSSFCVDEPLPKVAWILRVSEQLCFKVAFLIVNVFSWLSSRSSDGPLWGAKGNCVSEAAPQNVLLPTITVKSLHWGKVIRWLGRWTSLKSNTQMI